MTRFARAKGSKASNEKAPEDGTPWEVMKEQLLQAKKQVDESKHRQEAEKQRIENYENFLKEQKVKKRAATWCDFPETEQNLIPQSINQIEKEQPKKKKRKSGSRADSKTNSNNLNSEVTEISEKLREEKKNKKQLYKNENNIVLSNDTSGFNDELHTTPGFKNKKKKNKQKLHKEHYSADNNTSKTEPQSHKKKNKKKQHQNNALADNSQQNDTPDEILQLDKGSILKKQKITSTSLEDVDHKNQSAQNQNQKKAKKQKKLFNSKPVRRKEINDKSFQLIINTKEVELIRFDGFPIMKKDAERLTELRDSMIKKGIPKSEVQRTMKLERRRAEKALARLKREVCYNCRKGGHNLSDCPDLKSKIPGVDAAEGVCFKCGSTEHRQFECKVQRDKEFRFASCFICKEQGHIARQCPDNPKGLYPNGGSCKLCGDVTHLRKDCPTANSKKEDTSVKLQTLESTDNLEDIGVHSKTTTYDDSAKKPKKIKF